MFSKDFIRTPTVTFICLVSKTGHKEVRIYMKNNDLFFY